MAHLNLVDAQGKGIATIYVEDGIYPRRGDRIQVRDQPKPSFYEAVHYLFDSVKMNRGTGPSASDYATFLIVKPVSGVSDEKV
ncbi:MAG TPA: hypothetical protein VGI39_32915 [Polyangiaceae bacterium]